jgi:hypothetical protein
VIVGGRHQFFPKRELDTIEYSIGNIRSWKPSCNCGYLK